MQQNAASYPGLHCLLLIQQFLDTKLGSKLYLSIFRTGMVRSEVSKYLTLVLLNQDQPCLCKQCRSRSVGFFRRSGSALFAINVLFICAGLSGPLLFPRIPFHTMCRRYVSNNTFTVFTGVVGWGKGVFYLTSPGRSADIGLQLGIACYPFSRWG